MNENTHTTYWLSTPDNKNHLPNVLYDLESHAKDGRCALTRNENIRRFVGKLIEKQTLVLL